MVTHICTRSIKYQGRNIWWLQSFLIKWLITTPCTLMFSSTNTWKNYFGFIEKEAYNSVTTGVTAEYISILKRCNRAGVGVFTTFCIFHHVLQLIATYIPSFHSGCYNRSFPNATKLKILKAQINPLWVKPTSWNSFPSNLRCLLGGITSILGWSLNRIFICTCAWVLAQFFTLVSPHVQVCNAAVTQKR